MVDRFSHIKKSFERLVSRKETLGQQLEDEKHSLSMLEDELEASEQARAVIQQVAQTTQQKIEYRISTLVTSALSVVFPDPYTFKAEFIQKRNKTECELKFVKGENELSPMDASGGGPIDVTSFALRATFWSLKRNRPVLILDEPFKFVSAEFRPKCSEMLKMLSEKLEFQIITATHQPELKDCADRVFEVRLVDGVSQVSTAENTPPDET